MADALASHTREGCQNEPLITVDITKFRFKKEESDLNNRSKHKIMTDQTEVVQVSFPCNRALRKEVTVTRGGQGTEVRLKREEPGIPCGGCKVFVKKAADKDGAVVVSGPAVSPFGEHKCVIRTASSVPKGQWRGIP